MWVAVLFLLFCLFYPTWLIMAFVDHFKYEGVITSEEYTKGFIWTFIILAVLVLSIYFIGFQPDFPIMKETNR